MIEHDVQLIFETLQTVATSREWYPDLLNFVTSTLNPLLIIGNYIEAYFYARPTFDIQFSQESRKIDSVLGKWRPNIWYE